MPTVAQDPAQDPAGDQALVEAATDIARRFARSGNRTVAAAARNADGRIVSALNAYHFTGGPCTELVLIGAAAGGDGGGDGGRETEDADDAGETGGAVRSLPVLDLLPEAYVWAVHRPEET
ncbi:cytidine deaminase [Kitasatospora sp. NPDC056181]|uniref:cytidine deaminase n=1 Tax=Kitasatospora sp. NPDC056181 TaxID=3345737 RepID=UPI0035DE6805